MMFFVRHRFSKRKQKQKKGAKSYDLVVQKGHVWSPGYTLCLVQWGITKLQMSHSTEGKIQPAEVDQCLSIYSLRIS